MQQQQQQQQLLLQQQQQQQRRPSQTTASSAGASFMSTAASPAPPGGGGGYAPFASNAESAFLQHGTPVSASSSMSSSAVAAAFQQQQQQQQSFLLQQHAAYSSPPLPQPGASTFYGTATSTRPPPLLYAQQQQQPSAMQPFQQPPGSYPMFAPQQQQQQQQPPQPLPHQGGFGSMGTLLQNAAMFHNPHSQHHQLHHHHQHSHHSSASSSIYYGPFPTNVDLDTLPKMAPSTVALQHQQQQTANRQLSAQSQQPHFHARQAAQVARTSAAQLAAKGTPSGSSSLLEEVEGAAGSGRKSVDGSAKPPSAGQQSTGQDGKKGVADASHPYVQHRILSQKHSQKHLHEHPWSMLDIGGMMIRAVETMSPLFKTYSFLTALYLNHNQITYLPPAIGKLTHLLVLDVSFNRLRFLPSEIGQLRHLHELWVFDNLLETLPWELAWLKKLTFLGLDGNPLMKPNIGIMSDLDRRFDHPVAEVIYRAGPQGLLEWLRDQMPVDIMVPCAPPRRRWIRRVPPTEKAEDPLDETISFLSYNILCERYATQQQYWYTPSWALRWDFRRDRILQEIMELDADIVCVQEMDWAQYEDYWVPRLCGEVKSESMQPGVYTKPVDPDNGFNYSACFYPKSRFRSMSEKAKRSPNGGVDGCATFWRRNALQPVGQPFTIEFAQLALSRNDFQKNDTMFARFCSKDNIALAIVLERIETKQRVLVSNVHIHWDPLQTDVKLVQSYMLMEQLEKFTKKFLREQSANSSQKHLPTIICGDFNSLPGSLVYQFLSNPGGVREVGIHEDLKECFTPAIDSKSEAVSETTAETPSSSGISAESGANSSASSSTSNLVGSVDSPMPAADPSNSEDDPSVLKRWPNWKSSGYGDIAKTEVLKHYLSGSLMSAYGGIESVPIEGENIYIPPAHVLSSASNSTRKPPTYPVPGLPFTNHTAGFSGVIDYIWFTSDDFEVDGALGGYFQRADLGKDVVRWIREGQLNESQTDIIAGLSSPLHYDPSQHTDPLGNPVPLPTKSLFMPQSFSSTPATPLINSPAADHTSSRVWSLDSTRTIGFPNPVFPSDHIPVMCELRFKRNPGKNTNNSNSGPTKPSQSHGNSKRK